MSETQQPGTSVERLRFDAEDLRSLRTFEDAKRLAEESYGSIVDAAHEIGDGFTMVENKRQLIDVPMLLVTWQFTAGDFGEDYVICRAMTERGDKVIFVDGGTGICAQLREYEQRSQRTGGMLVPRGLRRSEYDTDETGKPTTDPSLARGRGETFYLNV